MYKISNQYYSLTMFTQGILGNMRGRDRIDIFDILDMYVEQNGIEISRAYFLIEIENAIQ